MKKPAPQTVTAFLVGHGLGIEPHRIPVDVKRIAQHCLLDWFSVTLAGSVDPDVGHLVDELRAEGGAAQATVLGSGEQLNVSQATLANGMASHVLDFDDAHLSSRVHPSVPLWPAILAFGEHGRLAGADAIAAFTAGVEVQARIAAVMGESHYRRGWHNTATLGGFGATMAIGRLRRLSASQLNLAMGIAATQASGLRAVFGTSSKPLQVGRAAANGVFATGLALRGFGGAADIFERADGYCAVSADEIDLAAAQNEPEHWHVRDIVFKYHASCYGTQAPIEAALRLRADSDLSAVDRVLVQIEPQYMSVCDIESPQTAREAKFSTRHMVALALSGRDTAHESAFSRAMLLDPVVGAWRNKISISGGVDLPRAHARVGLQRGDADPNFVTVDASRPEDDLDRQWQRLSEKSLRLLEGMYARSALEEMRDRISRFEYEKDLGVFMREVSGLLGRSRLCS